MNFIENMSVTKLIEHPENKKLFKDIKDTNPSFWLEFIDSIKRFGIIEPLIVNENTLQIRSGNQRFLAAIELGLPDVPVLMVNPEAETDDEIQKMIASNVYRRTIDPFSMMEYIGRLRNFSGKKSVKPHIIAKEVHKKHGFVCAADIFNSMSEEQQEAIKEWFNEQAEGEKAKSEGELIAQIRSLQKSGLDLEEELRNAKVKREVIEKEFDTVARKLEETKEELESLKVKEEDEDHSKKEIQLERTRATIRGLEEDKKKLQSKINELKGLPDINKIAYDISIKMSECLAKLTSISEYQDAINKNHIETIGYSANQIIKLLGVQNEL